MPFSILSEIIGNWPLGNHFTCGGGNTTMDCNNTWPSRCEVTAKLLSKMASHSQISRYNVSLCVPLCVCGCACMWLCAFVFVRGRKRERGASRHYLKELYVRTKMSDTVGLEIKHHVSCLLHALSRQLPQLISRGESAPEASISCVLHIKGETSNNLSS